MDKSLDPAPRRGGRLGGGAKAGRELASAVGSGSGNQRSRTESYRHSQGLLYATQKGKREVLEQGERRGVVTPGSHSIFPVCL